MLVSGRSADNNLVEIVELKDHPWFVASQFHPEFKSRPTRSHPLFRGFVAAAVARAEAFEAATHSGRSDVACEAVGASGANGRHVLETSGANEHGANGHVSQHAQHVAASAE
jgi:hypothetical protein